MATNGVGIAAFLQELDDLNGSRDDNQWLLNELSGAPRLGQFMPSYTLYPFQQDLHQRQRAEDAAFDSISDRLANLPTDSGSFAPKN